MDGRLKPAHADDFGGVDQVLALPGVHHHAPDHQRRLRARLQHGDGPQAGNLVIGRSLAKLLFRKEQLVGQLFAHLDAADGGLAVVGDYQRVAQLLAGLRAEAVRRLGERQVHRRVFTGERRTGGDRCGQRRSVYLHNRSAARNGVARLNGGYDRFQLEGDLLARLQRWNDPFSSVSIPAGAFLGRNRAQFQVGRRQVDRHVHHICHGAPPVGYGHNIVHHAARGGCLMIRGHRDGERGGGQRDRRVGHNGHRERCRRRAVARHHHLCGQVRSVSHAALHRSSQDKRQALASPQRGHRPQVVRIGGPVGRCRHHVFKPLWECDGNGRVGSRPSAGVGKRNRIFQRFARRDRIAAGNAVKH